MLLPLQRKYHVGKSFLILMSPAEERGPKKKKKVIWSNKEPSSLAHLHVFLP